MRRTARARRVAPSHELPSTYADIDTIAARLVRRGARIRAVRGMDSASERSWRFIEGNDAEFVVVSRKSTSQERRQRVLPREANARELITRERAARRGDPLQTLDQALPRDAEDARGPR